MKYKNKNSGQALITLIFFASIATIITTSAVAVLASSSSSASKMETASISRASAESGIEEAIIRLLRDPAYQGSTLTFNDATVNITVSGGSNKVITSTSTSNNITRKIVVTATHMNNTVTINTWQEEIN